MMKSTAEKTINIFCKSPVLKRVESPKKAPEAAIKAQNSFDFLLANSAIVGFHLLKDSIFV